jgi:hypothetical protein
MSASGTVPGIVTCLVEAGGFSSWTASAVTVPERNRLDSATDNRYESPKYASGKLRNIPYLLGQNLGPLLQFWPALECLPELRKKSVH